MLWVVAWIPVMRLVLDQYSEEKAKIGWGIACYLLASLVEAIPMMLASRGGEGSEAALPVIGGLLSIPTMAVKPVFLTFFAVWADERDAPIDSPEQVG